MAPAHWCGVNCASGNCGLDTAGVRRCCLPSGSPTPTPTGCSEGNISTTETACNNICAGGTCVNIGRVGGGGSGGIQWQCQSCPGTPPTPGGSTGGGGTLPPPAGVIDLGFFKIRTDPAGMAGAILNLGIGVGTLLAILYIIIGGYGVATSAGNPDNLEKAKKQITAAIAGLLFILMSVVILRIMGVNILGITFF